MLRYNGRSIPVSPVICIYIMKYKYHDIIDLLKYYDILEFVMTYATYYDQQTTTQIEIIQNILKTPNDRLA